MITKYKYVFIVYRHKELDFVREVENTLKIQITEQNAQKIVFFVQKQLVKNLGRSQQLKAYTQTEATGETQLYIETLPEQVVGLSVPVEFQVAPLFIQAA